MTLCAIPNCGKTAEPFGENPGHYAKPLCRKHTDMINKALSQIPHTTNRKPPEPGKMKE